MSCKSLFCILAGLLFSILLLAEASADIYMNFAENAPATCINLDNCDNVTDGNRYSYAHGNGINANTVATVYLGFMPDNAYVTELYWKGSLVIQWGGNWAELEVQEENGTWSPVEELDPVYGSWSRTVTLNPPRRIIAARMTASAGDHWLFGNVWDFYELEAWGYTPYVPEDVFYGYQEWSGSSADPVNTATGNFTHEETDLSIATRGKKLLFQRFYNSMDTSGGSLGPGWTHSYNIVLTEDIGEGQVYIRWENGKTDYWDEDGLGGYVPAYLGLYDELVKNGDSTWSVTRKNLDEYFFDAAGRLTGIADKNGNTTTLSFTNPTYPDLVTTVTDPAGRSLTLTYDANGLVESVSDFAAPAREVLFAYTSGRLSLVTDVMGYSIEYSYDGNGRLETMTDQRGVTTVTNIHDGEGRVIEQLDGMGNSTIFDYDSPAENQTTISNSVTVAGSPRTLQTVHTHEGDFHLLSSIENPLGNSVAFSYDGNNNRDAITDRNSNITGFTFDSRGNETSRTDANDPADPNDGGITITTYDDLDFPDLPTSRTDALGHLTEWTYDENGNVLTEVRWIDFGDTLRYHGQPQYVTRSFSYNEYGQVLTEEDECGNVTQYEYDDSGLLVSEIDPEGNQTWYGYDDLWRRIWVTDPRGSGPGDAAYTSTYVYDNKDRLIEIIGPPVGDPPQITITAFKYDVAGNKIQECDGNGYLTSFHYDGNNNLIRVEETLSGNPQGRVTEYIYDELNRKVAMINANGHMTTYLWQDDDKLITEEDAAGNTWIYTYDDHGNTLTKTDPSGVTSTYEYDALNRHTRTLDELGNEQTFQYDKLGRQTYAVDAEGSDTEYLYDTFGRLACVVDAEEGWTEYAYDACGNLITMEDAGDHKVSRRWYDGNNRLIRKEDGLGYTLEFGYDPIGNLAWRTSHKLTTNYCYDAENRLTFVDYPDDSQVLYFYDQNGNILRMIDDVGLSTFTYDERNLLTSSIDEYGKEIQYEYDPVGNRISLTYPDGKQVAYGYDVSNRLVTITDWNANQTVYTYAGFLQETVTFPNGLTETRAYDAAGRLSSITTEDASKAVLMDLAWTRDGVGCPTSLTEIGTLPPALSYDNTTYEYDRDNRLTSSSIGSYTHDRNGNLVNRTVSGVTSLFTYDTENRLVSQKSGLSIIRHIYNGFGDRVARIQNQIAKRYVLDQGRSMSHVLCETDQSGSITAYFIHGHQLLARVSDGNIRYYHANDIGSVLSLSDETGTMTDRYGYAPFGGGIVHEGDTYGNPFTYVGALGVMQETDGLYFMRARFYDAETGRFLSKDPLEGKSEDPNSLHKYIYAYNVPVLHVDPEGEAVITPENMRSFLLEGTKSHETSIPEMLISIAMNYSLDIGSDILVGGGKTGMHMTGAIQYGPFPTVGAGSVYPAGRPLTAAAVGYLGGIAGVLGVLSDVMYVWEIGVEGIDVLQNLSTMDYSEAAKQGLSGKELSDYIMKKSLQGNFNTSMFGLN